MNESIVVVVTAVAMSTLLLVVLIWQMFRYAQIRVASEKNAAADAAYRDLLRKYEQLQQTGAEQQRKLAEELSALKSRVSSIENILKQVE